LETIKEYVDTFKNFQTIGRNGLHRYNNQDHAMLTGMLAVRNILRGESHDLWQVNTEQEYLETIITKDPLSIPPHVVPKPRLIGQTLSLIDDTAIGLSLGLLTAVLTYFLTLLLV
jgi:hypothetical protein